MSIRRWSSKSFKSHVAGLLTKIRHSHGKANPIYDYAHMTTTAMPFQFNDLERVECYPAMDTMYLSGYSPSQPTA